MKGWKVTEPYRIAETERNEPFDNTVSSKVKVTKALITLSDVLRYNWTNKSNFILGTYGIGVVSETGENMFSLQKDMRVYLSPVLDCKECYNCRNGDKNHCSDLQIAGENFDGFLSDFAVMPTPALYFLPESVSDEDALYVDYVSQAISIIDKLEVQKGEHVAVIGGDNLSIILAQLLIYYQAVPILIDTDPGSIEIAKSTGIYYTLGADENWIREVSSLTGGRMAKHVVYNLNSSISARTAFNLAGFNSPVAITGNFMKNSPISFVPAMKKQLHIFCVNSGYGNIEASINLIANNAVNFSKLKHSHAKYEDVPNVLAEMAAQYEKSERVSDTVIDLL